MTHRTSGSRAAAYERENERSGDPLQILAHVAQGPSVARRERGDAVVLIVADLDDQACRPARVRVAAAGNSRSNNDSPSAPAEQRDVRLVVAHLGRRGPARRPTAT